MEGGERNQELRSEHLQRGIHREGRRTAKDLAGQGLHPQLSPQPDRHRGGSLRTAERLRRTVPRLAGRIWSERGRPEPQDDRHRKLLRQTDAWRDERRHPQRHGGEALGKRGQLGDENQQTACRGRGTRRTRTHPPAPHRRGIPLEEQPHHQLLPPLAPPREQRATARQHRRGGAHTEPREEPLPLGGHQRPAAQHCLRGRPILRVREDRNKHPQRDD